MTPRTHDEGSAVLRALTLTNWKSFGEERNRLDFAPLTLMVGPNGSGKSNALDALRFLQGAALDFPLGDVLAGRWEGERQVWPGIRGHAVEAARDAGSVFGIDSEWTLGGSRLLHHIEVDTAKGVLLHAEHLSAGHKSKEFGTHASSLGTGAGRQAGGAINVALRSTGRGKLEPQTHSAARSLLGQVNTGGRVVEEAIANARRLQAAMRNVAFLDVQPSRMRDYKPTHMPALGTSAENISPILHALKVDQMDLLEDVVGWVSELCAPTVKDIDFDVTALKEVMFFLNEAPSTKVSARSVSDGTLRFLGLVTALLTADRDSLIVLEEPDVGLHPARIHLLAQLLEQVTAEGRIQVLATTHSPTLLAHLSLESLANVMALGRAEGGTTACARLGTLDHFDTLRDSTQLDHLVSTGWIERAL